MSQQSPQKVLDRILNYPHKEKECVYLCGPHLEPCVMVRAHDGDGVVGVCRWATGEEMTEEQAREAAKQTMIASLMQNPQNLNDVFNTLWSAATEYANRWTYLPELPKDYDFYLVTHKDENDNVMVSESLFASERWDVDNVIAWRELPEPADIR